MKHTAPHPEVPERSHFFIPALHIHGTIVQVPEHPGRRGMIVLLHNGFDSRKSWKNIEEPLAKAGWIAVSYDRIGYGESWHPDNLPGTDGNMVNTGRIELGAVLESSEFTQALGQAREGMPLALAGHCMGGAIALEYTLAHPDKVDALVLEAVGYRSTPAIRRRTDWVLQPWHVLDEQIKTHLVDMHGPNASRSWEHIHTHRSSYVMHESYDMTPRLPQVLCPTLIMQGDRDFYFDIPGATEACKLLDRGQLACFSGMGHDLHARHSESYLGAVIPFLGALLCPEKDSPAHLNNPTHLHSQVHRHS